jgi:hypothetical protein
MMKGILNAVRQQVQRILASYRISDVGSITSFDPNTWTAKVTLQSDGAMTGWLQLNSPWVGNQWGMFAAPSIGDLVDVLFTTGDINSGIIVSRSFNQVNQPLPVKSGEFWLVHKLLQSLKLTNDGKIAITDGHGATITMNGDGTITSAATTWNHTGNVNVTGTLAATVDVTAANISLVSHTHLVAGVQPGSGAATSNPPTG